MMPAPALTRISLLTSQEGVWFAQQLMPDSPVFNIGQAVWLDGVVEADVFARAWARTWDEAQVLRSVFHDDDGGVTVTTPDRPAPWAVVDLSGKVDVSGEDDPESAARAAMHADLAVPRALSGDDLVGSVLYRLAPQRWVWHLRIHHILIDAYGLSLVSKRVAGVYTALISGVDVADSDFASLAEVVEASGRDADAVATDRDYWTAAVDGRGVVRPLSGVGGALVCEPAPADSHPADDRERRRRTD